MATRRQIALFEAYEPQWSDIKIKPQVTEIPTLSEVQATLDGGISPDLSFSEWLSEQSIAYQRSIFGSTETGMRRYEAWRSGDLIVDRLPRPSPISFATLQMRNGNADPEVVANIPLAEIPAGVLPRRTAARIRRNAANAPTFNGVKLLTPDLIPNLNFDALAAFLHSLTPQQVAEVLPASVLLNWRLNPTAAGLRYNNGKDVSFALVVRKLTALLSTG